MLAAAPVDPPARPPAVVRLDRLLWPYAVVPLCLIALAADRLLAHGQLAQRLPRHPDQLLFFTLIFNLPHILVSHLLFFDREYAAAYGKRLALVVAVLLPLTLIAARVSLVAWGALVLLYTCYHITAQQVGLVGMQLRTSSRLWTAWRWLTLFIGCAGIFGSIDQPVYSRLQLGLLTAAWLAVIPWCGVAVRLARLAPSAQARRYLWANQAMFFGVLLSWALGYPLFAALMPRVVHDLTALYIYGVHDINRNAAQPRNLFHRVLAPLHLPAWLIAPLLALALTYLIERRASPALALAITYWASSLHYYFEGVVWRGPTIHRRSTPFA